MPVDLAAVFFIYTYIVKVRGIKSKIAHVLLAAVLSSAAQLTSCKLPLKPLNISGFFSTHY